MHLLVVEDDPGIGKSLARGFTEAGHSCDWVKSGEVGLEQAVSQRFDAIILDLLLPGLPGLEVLRALRNQGVQTPVLLLTAMGAIDQRVLGLKAGADDYVVKPFAFDEVLARLEAVCRRTQDRPPAQLTAGDLILDLTTRRVMRNEQIINLTPTEFSLLEMLMRHGGQVVTRKMLCEHIWDADWEGETNLIEVHVNRLRKKLDRDGETPIIQTVRGRGYALRAP
jgi:two-component system OmpR family response regulator/two-component system copper resistance phosphate regulon response regulator CusR